MAIIRAEFDVSYEDTDYGLPEPHNLIIPARSIADEILRELREHHAKMARADKGKAETKPMTTEQAVLIGTESKRKRDKVYAFTWAKPWTLDDGRVYVKHQGQWWICSKTCPKAVAYFDELNADGGLATRNWHELQLRRLTGWRP